MKLSDKLQRARKWLVAHWGFFNPNTRWCGWCGRYEKECQLSGLLFKLKEDYQRTMQAFSEALLPAVAGFVEAMKPIVEACKEGRSGWKG